jgi:hypothetical protein
MDKKEGPVIISVKRSGGFAGVTEDLGTVNTEQRDAMAANKLEQLVRNVDFFNLPAKVSGGVGFDQFRYEITITDGEWQHTVAFDDDNSPETMPLRQLVEALHQMK